MKSYRGRMPSSMSRSRQWAARWLTVCSVLPMRAPSISRSLMKANLKTKSLKYSGNKSHREINLVLELCCIYSKSHGSKMEIHTYSIYRFIPLVLHVLTLSLFVLYPRFVRREKEIAESRFEMAQGESLRHRLRVEHLEHELKEVHGSLSAARERMQVSFNTHQYPPNLQLPLVVLGSLNVIDILALLQHLWPLSHPATFCWIPVKNK